MLCNDLEGWDGVGGRLKREGTHVCCCHVAELLSRVGLFCDPMDCSPPGSSVHGISQARILEWVAISLSRGSSQPRDWTYIGRQILYHWAIREALDICILRADSHRCTMGTNATLESNYPPIKKKKRRWPWSFTLSHPKAQAPSPLPPNSDQASKLCGSTRDCLGVIILVLPLLVLRHGTHQVAPSQWGDCKKRSYFT